MEKEVKLAWKAVLMLILGICIVAFLIWVFRELGFDWTTTILTLGDIILVVSIIALIVSLFPRVRKLEKAVKELNEKIEEQQKEDYPSN